MNNCIIDQENPVKQCNKVPSGDNLRANSQVQSPLNDIDEFIKRNTDETALPVPPIADSFLALPKVG